MRSHSTVVIVTVVVVAVRVITTSLCADADPADGSTPFPSRTNRETDDGGGQNDFGNGRTDRADFDLRRTVYHHVSDGSSSSSDDGGGWIIGGSRRRASAGTHKYYQDKAAADEKTRWPAAPVGPDAASSLSEVQVVVHQSPHRRNEQQQQQQPSDALSKWYSKRLSYVTKTSPATLQQPVAAGSNAVLLAEVLGQKSGFNATSSAVTTTGSKGFQNDLMDMLGKSMCRIRFHRTFKYVRARVFFHAVYRLL